MSIACATLALSLVLATTAVASAGSVLNRGNLSEPGTLDPAQQTLAAEYEILSDLFTGLVQLSPRGESIPGAAESWTTSADGLTTTFKLRDGLMWSDGVKLTADDFVYAFRRSLDPKTRCPGASMAFKIKNAEAINSGKLPLTALGVHAPDGRTVVIELGEPSPILPLLLAQPMLWPVPRHLIEKHPNDWTKPGILVSDGPYVLAEWRAHDHIKLEKNPRYYDAGRVRIDIVNYLPTDDAATSVRRFRVGELDLNMDFPPSDTARLRQILPKGSVRTSPSYRIVYLVLNVLKPPFSDPRARRAISLAVDRDAISEKILRSGEAPSFSVMPQGLQGYTQAELDFKNWPAAKRLTEAKRLLALAGYTADHPLKFEFATIADQAQKRVTIAIADMLKSVGVEVDLRAEDSAVHYNRLRTRDFAMGWSAGISPGDPEFVTHLLLTASVEDNNGGYSNPDFDAKHAEAVRTLDTKKRMQLFREAEQIALRDNAIVPLYTGVNRSLVAPYVKGWEENPENTHPTRWMWIDRK